MRCVFLILVAFVVAGCGKGGPAGGPGSSGVDAQKMQPRRLAAFAAGCDSGATIVARQMPGGALELMLPSGMRSLQRVEAASGAKFQGQNAMLWIKGREAMLDVDGRLTRCFEDRRASMLEDARARGVRIWGSGKKPDWLLEVTETAIHLATVEERLIFPSTPASNSDGAQVITTRAGERQLRMKLIKSPCEPQGEAESESDEMKTALNLTLTLDLDGEELTGCGLDLR